MQMTEIQKIPIKEIQITEVQKYKLSNYRNTSEHFKVYQ